MLRRLLFLVLGLLAIAGVTAWAQSKPKSKGKDKKPPSITEVRALDTEFDKAQEDYVRSLVGVANGYEAAGLTEKAKETLQSILQINPESESARKKLEELDQRAFNENEVLVEVEAGKGWVSAKIAVMKGKPISLEVTGDYRLTMNETVGPEGLPTGDPKHDMAPGLPVGALIGVIAPPNGDQNPNQNQNDNQNQNNNKESTVRPFLVGKGAERFEPKEDGLLLLKLNVPASSKSAGKIRIQIRGNLKDLQSSNAK